jgi:Tfp pilus assembly protein PilF
VSSNQVLSSAQATLYLRVQATLQRGDRATALQLAQDLLRQAPASADAHHLQAMCLGFTDPHAGQAFERALALLPDSVLILGNYARWLRRQGRPEEAAARLSRMTQLEPAKADAWCELGLAQLELRRFQSASESLSRALSLAPDQVRAWHGRGNALRALGLLEEAASCFQRALSLDPGAAACLVNLGAVRRELGDSHSALAHYRQARAMGMDAPELDDAIHGTLADVGNIDAALDGAKALVARAPGYAPGQETLLELLWEYGGEAGDDPLQRFRQDAEAMPGHLPLQLAWLKALIQGGRTAEALEWGGCLLQLHPEHPELYWLLADAEVSAGRLDAAGRCYARAMPAFGTRSSTFLNGYVRYLLRAGRPESAAHWAARATGLDATNQESWALLSTAWRLLDDPLEHWLCDYERFIGVVDLPPDDPASGWSLDELQASLERRHNARRAPTAQSVRGGSQTRGRLFGGDDPLLAAVASDLQAQVARWAASLPVDPRHPFLARASGQVRFSGSWSVRLWSSGQHVNHIHSQGWISSAFYVALPPSVAQPAPSQGDAGCLRFGAPLESLGLQLPARRVIRPQPGRLVLFPSYMWHGTVPFDDHVPRLTIAFDAVPVRVSPGLPG